ncbi:MAG TPA: META domain-containing protein [Usitatibacter sp.]|nr:META domain-containing protein [Usitatibacter sp.]
MRAVLASCALLVACAADPPAPPQFASTRWVGSADAGEPAHTPTLEFVNADHIAGYTGCNMLSGQWHPEGDAVRISRVVITKRACAGPGSDIERRVLAAINDNSRVTREGNRLVAVGASGARYEFSAAK